MTLKNFGRSLWIGFVIGIVFIVLELSEAELTSFDGVVAGIGVFYCFAGLWIFNVLIENT